MTCAGPIYARRTRPAPPTPLPAPTPFLLDDAAVRAARAMHGGAGAALDVDLGGLLLGLLRLGLSPFGRVLIGHVRLPERMVPARRPPRGIGAEQPTGPSRDGVRVYSGVLRKHGFRSRGLRGGRRLDQAVD